MYIFQLQQMELLGAVKVKWNFFAGVNFFNFLLHFILYFSATQYTHQFDIAQKNTKFIPWRSGFALIMFQYLMFTLHIPHYLKVINF